MVNGMYYRVGYNVTNGAGESVIYYTQPVFVDSTAPTLGYLKFRNVDLTSYEYQAFYYPHLTLENDALWQFNTETIRIVWEKELDASGNEIYWHDAEMDSGEKTDYAYWGIDHFEWSFGTGNHDSAQLDNLKAFSWVEANVWRSVIAGRFI